MGIGFAYLPYIEMNQKMGWSFGQDCTWGPWGYVYRFIGKYKSFIRFFDWNIMKLTFFICLASGKNRMYEYIKEHIESLIGIKSKFPN